MKGNIRFQRPSQHIKSDIDQSCLKVHLSMFPDMIKTALDGSAKKVATIRTLTDAMSKNDIYQGILSEVDKLILLFL